VIKHISRRCFITWFIIYKYITAYAKSGQADIFDFSLAGSAYP